MMSLACVEFSVCNRNGSPRFWTWDSFIMNEIYLHEGYLIADVPPFTKPPCSSPHELPFERLLANWVCRLYIYLSNPEDERTTAMGRPIQVGFPALVPPTSPDPFNHFSQRRSNETVFDDSHGLTHSQLEALWHCACEVFNDARDSDMYNLGFPLGTIWHPLNDMST